MSIRLQLLSIFFFTCVIAVSSLAYISIKSSTNTILNELELSLNGIADEKRELAYRFIEDNERLTASMAEGYETGRAFLELSNKFKLGEKSKEYLAAVQKYRNLFRNFKRRYQLHNVFLIEPGGNVIYNVEQELIFGKNLYDSTHKHSQLANSFKKANELLETQMTRFERFIPYSNTTEINSRAPEDIRFYSSFVATPIFVEEKFVGVFAIQISSKNYYHLSLDYSGLKQSGEVIIAHIEDGNVLIISPLRHKKNATFQLSYLVDSDNALLLQKSATGNRGSGPSISYDGTDIIAAWRHIPELGWGIVTKMQTQEALKPILQLTRTFILSGLIILLLSLLIAFYFSERISERITKLLIATRLLSDGKLEHQIKVSGKDEISELSTAFNNMLKIRQQQEKAIQNSNLKTKQLLLELNQQKYALDQHSIVAITNIKGDITFCNDKLVEISGYSRKQLIGQNHRILNSGYHPKTFFTEMYRSISNGKVWHGEICNKKQDGSYYWVDTTIVPFMEKNNKPTSYIAIRTDLTERKKQEISLVKAKEDAEQAAISKSEFLASMSHEIRTPMNGVLGMLGLLKNTDLSSDQRHKANIAQSSAKSLLSLINDILDFSKVDAGKLELEYMDFNLRNVLGDFSDSIAHQAQDKGLELILDITHINESNVIGDSSRLRQILYNIVGNSIKFTASGEIVISANIQSLDQEHWQFNCEVSDTGIGIPKNKLNSLFDSFSQVDASTTRRYGGTGLGLAIVKKLCELMGGEVSVTSELGKGTSFSFNIKLQKSLRSKVVMPKIEVDKLNILIIDDNKTNREVLRGQLEHWRASVWEAESGKQALDICNQRSLETNLPFFDIALLDMQMPDMDGAELGEHFKINEHFQSMKLVMMTSVGHKGDAKYFASLGFSAYFSKPATTSDIFDTLSVVMDGGESMKHANPLVTSRYLQTLDKTTRKRNKTSKTNWPDGTEVLLVEDNQINQMVALGILEEMGLNAQVAGHGGEALISLQKSANDQKFTLILMDCQMPEMDGYEATRQIRKGSAGERYINIPIIAMTANAMNGDRDLCIASGMNDYLTKPIEPEILQNILIKWLGASKASTDNKLLENKEKSEITDILDITENNLIVWDEKTVLNRLMGNKPLLNNLVKLFIENNAKNMNAIVQAIEHKNTIELRQATHLLKGVVANLGGSELKTYLAQMDSAAQADNLKLACESLTEVERANKSLMRCFKQFVNNENSSNLAKNIEFEPSKLKKLLLSLDKQLSQNDFIDTEELDPLKQTCNDISLQRNLEILASQITVFDNDSARETIKTINLKLES